MSGRKTFRVGRVTGYLRGPIWYLRYTENGARRQPRVGPDRDTTRQLASQINAQVEVGMPSLMGFVPISISDLQQQWLAHHEDVRRSSASTIRRYRTATRHLVKFTTDVQPVRLAAHFQSRHAEAFVRYLRALEVAPNGHRKARRRRLRDNGLVYILETCRTLFHYAAKHRHLSPYAENPFAALEINRIPIEDAKPVLLLEASEEQRLLEAADDWFFPILLTLAMTGLRPGELRHLLLPDDLDLAGGWLRVRNKTGLGWQTKTRNERDVPFGPEVGAVLGKLVGDRKTGPVFLRERAASEGPARLPAQDLAALRAAFRKQIEEKEAASKGALSREERDVLAIGFWNELAAVDTDRIRVRLSGLLEACELPAGFTPKSLRHMYATTLQDGGVATSVSGGGRFVLVDNVSCNNSYSITSPALERTLTSPLFHFRKLGTTTAIEGPNDLRFIITLNEGVFGSDLASRAVYLNLHYEGDPARRPIPAIGDPLDYAKAHRADLLAEILGLVERWKTAGRPLVPVPGFRFGAWAALINGILLANGVTHFLHGHEIDRETYDQRNAELAAMAAERPDEYLKSSDWVNVAVEVNTLVGEIAAATSAQARATRMGRYLSRLVGRVLFVENPDTGQTTRYRLASRCDTRNGTHQYAFVLLGDDGADRPNGGEPRGGSDPGGRGGCAGDAPPTPANASAAAAATSDDAAGVAGVAGVTAAASGADGNPALMPTTAPTAAGDAPKPQEPVQTP